MCLGVCCVYMFVGVLCALIWCMVDCKKCSKIFFHYCHDVVCTQLCMFGCVVGVFVSVVCLYVCCVLHAFAGGCFARCCMVVHRRYSARL